MFFIKWLWTCIYSLRFILHLQMIYCCKWFILHSALLIHCQWICDRQRKQSIQCYLYVFMVIAAMARCCNINWVICIYHENAKYLRFDGWNSEHIYNIFNFHSANINGIWNARKLCGMHWQDVQNIWIFTNLKHTCWYRVNQQLIVLNSYSA